MSAGADTSPRHLGALPGLWSGCVNSGNILVDFARIIRRGFACLCELPPAPADNCVSKSRVSRAELVSATAWPASAGPGVYSRRWPASPRPSRSLAPRPNTFVPVTKAPVSPSGSARFAALPSSTPKTVTARLSVSPWVRLPTPTFQRLGCLSMTAAGSRGCSCRRARRLSPKILSDRAVSAPALRRGRPAFAGSAGRPEWHRASPAPRPRRIRTPV